MSNEHPEPSERGRRLDEIAAAYIQAREANGPQDRQQWLNRYAELANELESFISDYEKIHPLPDPPRTTVDFLNSAVARKTTPGIWKVGDKIDERWEVHEIMAGGMGLVYVLYDHEEESPIAAKTFKDHALGRDFKTVRRFEQESAAWIDLDVHQNVTRAEFVHNVDGQPLLFMEYVNGGDLSKQIGTAELIGDPKTILRLAIQFCDGMTHVLSRGIKVHRDIKPQNCLITKTGTLKISDFGLAKVFDEIPYPYDLALGETARTDPGLDTHSLDTQDHPMNRLSVGITGSGVAAGTCTHMAPEQFVDAKNVDVRADIYSFGVMLYQMAAGTLPFRARKREEFELLHKNAAAPHLPSAIAPFWRECTDELDQLIQECLAKDSISRPASFTDVRNRLERIFHAFTGEHPPMPVVGDELEFDQIANKAVSLMNLSRFDEAIDCTNRLLIREDLSPRSRWLFLGLRGVARQEVDELHAAEADLTASLQMTPPADAQDDQMRNRFIDMRGSVRARIGDARGAIDDFTRIIEAQRVSLRTRTHAHFMRGVQRRKTNDIAGAKEDLRAVLQAPDTTDIQQFKESADKILAEFEKNEPTARSQYEFECAWCDETATQSVTFAVFDLMFPVCADPTCVQSLEIFLRKWGFIILGDDMGAANDPVVARQVNKLRRYVKMQSCS